MRRNEGDRNIDASTSPQKKNERFKFMPVVFGRSNILMIWEKTMTTMLYRRNWTFSHMLREWDERIRTENQLISSWSQEKGFVVNGKQSSLYPKGFWSWSKIIDSKSQKFGFETLDWRLTFPTPQYHHKINKKISKLSAQEANKIPQN